MRAKFPSPGSTVTRPLVAKVPTEPAANETLEAFAQRRDWCAALGHVQVVVRLVRDEIFDELRHRYLLWQVEEERRKAALEAAGEAVPALTAEGRKAMRALHRDAISLLVVSVTGVDVGEVSSDELRGDELVNLIADAGLLADVATVGRSSQAPTPVQLER